MNKKIIGAICGFIALSFGVMAYLSMGHTFAIFDVHGVIADKQRSLLIFATLLSLVVVIPVFVLTFWIVWRYRETNNGARYTPDWDHNRKLETVWWGIPILLIGILSIVTWQSSHTLDPFRPLASNKPAMTIQVVALQWKWLFIYPDQHVATINELHIPTNTPITLDITSDAPMNSFWLPQLAGQIYAMSGMSTQLHLNAERAGVYRGVSANISGEGFAHMQFTATATNQAAFNAWVTYAQTKPALTFETYNKLVKPSSLPSRATYGSIPQNLYGTIVMKYMPLYSANETHGMGH